MDDYEIYTRLSKSRFERNQQLRRTLTKLATMELKHYRFWKQFCSPEEKITVSRVKVNWILLLRLLLGVTFATRYLERNESQTIQKYKAAASLVPRKHRKRFGEMVSDEENHERRFSEQFEESHVKYISFIVLGLADALVEIAGIHAGSLGIYNSTELAGLAGIVAGAAASLAMASAAYAQAKTGFEGSAALSAVYTGISYFITAVILASPYFVTKSMVGALFSSLCLAVLLVAFISFYGSVISGTIFVRDFVEITSIMLGATFALYVLGMGIRYFTGITI